MVRGSFAQNHKDDGGVVSLYPDSHYTVQPVTLWVLYSLCHAEINGP